MIFRQPRRGQFGRLFSIYKFRSLHTAKADANADTLVTKGDSRVTRVGRFIRKYSIDELPQIINVLKGDMSLVGPRPHAIMAKADGKLYGDVVPNYSLRYRVKPGMTGWAQVNGWRGETDTEEKLRKRVEFDFYYISHWSWRLDLKILLRHPAGNAVPLRRQLVMMPVFVSFLLRRERLTVWRRLSDRPPCKLRSQVVGCGPICWRLKSDSSAARSTRPRNAERAGID